MSILEEYWSGILSRLQAEVDSFNRLIAHQGEKGRENELALARILERLIPARYGVGSGLLIDASGNYSKQIDIIVYDHADQPTMMAQTEQMLYPVELVRLCIEVKTTVDSEEIRDSLAKRDSIHRLRSHAEYPVFALVGYSAAVHPRTLAEHIRKPVDADRLDIVCVLQSAFVANRIEFGSGTADYTIGIAALHDVDEQRNRILGSHPVAGPDEGAYVLRNGIRYPTVKVGRDYLIAEPSRALLLFCESILNALQDSGENSIMSRYITDIARDLAAI